MVTVGERTRTGGTAPVLRGDLMRSVVVSALATSSSYVLAHTAGWVTEVDLLEAFAVFTSYACTYLCVKQRRINYPIGALSTAAYCLLFWRQGLYASMALNAYLTPSLVYGWFRWRADAVARPVARVEPRWAPVYIAVTAAAFVGALLMVRALGGTFALADSVILVGSLLAQFLLDNKKIETWAVWAIVNVVAIWAYGSAGLYIAALQYVFFLANAFWGASQWSRSLAARPEEERA